MRVPLRAAVRAFLGTVADNGAGTSARSAWGVAARLLVTVAVLGACSKSDPPTGPTQTPAALRAQTGTLQTGSVGSTLVTPLSVVVTDASGKTISGARVDWDASAGSGSTNPSSSTTNTQGVATTVWTLGTVAGTARVTAQVTGVTPVTFSATALAAAAAAVIVTPELANLGVGDTLRLRATVRDQFGNDIAGQAVTYTAAEPAIANVSTTGLVTAVSVGSARVIAAASGRADTVALIVLPAGASACGIAAPRELALGEVFVPASGTTSASACLSAPPGVAAEFALTLISSSQSFSIVTPVDVYALGNTAPTASALVAGLAAGGASTIDMEARAQPSSLAPAQAAELARREMERTELSPLVSVARDWQSTRAAASATSMLRSAAAEAKVGDIIKLNANANQGCSNPDTRTGRVAAVGTRAIVVADTTNPTGGYSDAEYADILATFDTLIFPIDTAAFGSPSNISTFGKIILFYTRNVNALTPSGANYTIGGFFFARDLYPKVARNNLAACPASNEQEMFYLLVPDPNGTINSNRRAKPDVNILNLGTIAHELQHLINASRRLYVNTNAVANEQTWLDEGLAHIAEELLYFRMSGFTSRQNLTIADVGGSPARATLFSNFASQNFSRFYSFLLNPEGNSPYAPNDSLATRGAIWNFLRYAAGRQGVAGESAFLRSVVNSSSSGIANLSSAIPGGQFADYLLDWTVSVIADDFSATTTAGLDPKYVLQAWNFRSIYPGLRFGGGSALGVYPINARRLLSNAPQRISLAGGTSSYVRFGVAAGRSALLTLSSNGGAIPGQLKYAVVRLR